MSNILTGSGYTQEQQIAEIDKLRADGYVWNKAKSTSSAGVVLEKGDDLYYFSLDGEIMHNPQSMSFSI